MSESEELIAEIDRFLLKKMSTQEANEFESRLLENPDLKKRVEDQKMVIFLAQVSGAESLNQKNKRGGKTLYKKQWEHNSFHQCKKKLVRSCRYFAYCGDWRTCLLETYTSTPKKRKPKNC